MTTAASFVVINHTELGVRVAVTVLRRTVTTSTDVLWQVSPDLAQRYVPIAVKFLWVLIFGFITVFYFVDRNNVKKQLLLASEFKVIYTKVIITVSINIQKFYEAILQLNHIHTIQKSVCERYHSCNKWYYTAFLWHVSS